MTEQDRTRFAGGSGTVIVLGSGAAAVAGDSSAPAASIIYSALERCASLESLMTDLSGLGFASLPSFAIVVAEAGRLRILHRGDTTVRTVDIGDAVTIYRQPTVSTWREEIAESVVRIDLEIHGAGEQQLDDAMQWFSGSGVVAGSAVRWWVPASTGVGQMSLPAAAAAAAAAVRQEPEPEAELASAPEAMMEPEPATNADSVRVELPDELTREPPVSPDDVEPPRALAVAVELVPPSPDPSPVHESNLHLSTSMGEADDLDFANFVDHTVYRRAEDAAVRPIEGAGDEPHSTDLHVSDTPPTVFMSMDTLMAERTRPPTDLAMIDAVPGRRSSVQQADGYADNADHDGHTVARPRKRPPQSGASSAIAGQSAVMVQAVFCAEQHPNPSNASACRECGAAIVDRVARMAPRPSLGVLRFSTKQTISLTAPLLIGRNPPASQQVDAEKAGIVEIDNSELSRLHVAVHIVDWQVHIADQGSTNGTVVTLAGHPPQTLRPFEKLQITPGAVVDLGGAVTFAFERS